MLSTTARREHAETQTFSDLKDLVEDAAWDLWKKYEETITQAPRKERNATHW